MQPTVLLFGIKTAECSRYPRCGCTDGSCGRSDDKNGHLKCGLDGKISLARAEVKEAMKNQEHARMAFSDAIKTLRAIPKDNPQYGPARAHRSLMQKNYTRLQARADEAGAVLNGLVGRLRDIESREQAAQDKVEARSRKAWAKTCQRAQSTPAPEVVSRPTRVTMRGTVRAPCGALCANAESAEAHVHDCDVCIKISEVSDLSEGFIPFREAM